VLEPHLAHHGGHGVLGATPFPATGSPTLFPQNGPGIPYLVAKCRRHERSGAPRYLGIALAVMLWVAINASRQDHGYAAAIALVPIVSHSEFRAMVSATTSGPTEEAPGRRKLIAVVYADMVGYSRLIELDDAGTIKRLRALRSGLIDPAIDEHGGRLVQTGGDSLLIAFDSVDGAVRCAIKVQQQLPKFDSDQPPDRAIRFRIGINFGDVIADGTDLHGDMVNVAARLQAECPVGAICITRAVRDHVQQRLDLALEELGPLKLKNIARPVEAFVLRVDETAAAQKPRDQLPPQDLGDTSQPAGQSTAGLVDAPGGGSFRNVSAFAALDRGAAVPGI
jgi:class 3 adenylate cyclase